MADPPATGIDDITDDLLELIILLCVPSSACLVRAASVCKLWRRVIAGARFLRRLRCRHAPAVAGYYYNHSLSSFDPLPSPKAGTGVDLRHMSLDFLSDMVAAAHDAKVADSRGSLLLLEFFNPESYPGDFPDALVVCEPLTRRHRRIPPLRDINSSNNCQFERSYLIDGEAADELGRCISMSNFRVLCEVYRDGTSHAALFTAGDGDGGGDAEGSWREKAIDHIFPRIDYMRRVLGRADGSWYFYNEGMAGVVLDGRTGEYSPFALPGTSDWDLHGRWSSKFDVTDGHDGKPRIVSALDNTLKVFARVGGDWVMEKKAPA
ncbi:hypothetical protein ACP4OV_005544 [Aristida adscensionis]